MHPVLIDRPGFHLEAYNGFVFLALIFVVLVGPPLAAALDGIDANRVRRAAPILIPVYLIGARAHFVLNNWDLYAGHALDALKIWTGGLHIGGGVIAFVLAVPWATARVGLPLGKFADGIAPTAAFATAVGRVGCFLQGCCFGKACTWPWCLTFPEGSWVYWTHRYQGLLVEGATRSAPVHPLQLYFMAGGIAVGLVALWLHGRKRYDGQVALVALFAFSVMTTVLELFRAEYVGRPYWGPLPQLLWTGIAMVLASAVALAMGELSHRRRTALGTGVAVA